MSSKKFESARTMAQALLEGWAPLQWELMEYRKFAALRMAPPGGVNAKQAHRLFCRLLRESLSWGTEVVDEDVVTTAVAKELEQQHIAALERIEAQLGPRPTKA